MNSLKLDKKDRKRDDIIKDAKKKHFRQDNKLITMQLKI